MSARYIEGIPVSRARERYTLAYSLTPRLRVGIEANTRVGDYGPLVNWRVLDETEKRPAIILGTSSDRIGTPRGRAYYGTFSKDLTHLSGLPMAPYVGIAYGEFDDEFVGIGGLRIRWDTDLSSTHFWDGHNLHHSLDRNFGDGYRVGLLLVDQENTYYMGMSIGLSL